jgi:hypothetical protein
VHVSFVGNDHGRAADHGSELLCLSDAPVVAGMGALRVPERVDLRGS